MTDAYAQFLERKRMVDPATGMDAVPELPSFMFDHQRAIASWALRRGRAAIFAGTGLGKTAMELVWGNAVADHTDKPVLVFAPLAVSQQHIREAGKFGLPARIVRDQSEVRAGVNVTNYQKIEHFDLSAMGGVVLDESSILKSTDGKYRTRLIEQCAEVPFRLAATATPAPNDFMELGNHAEFLGVMSYTDMLATFFTHDGGDTQKWRLKGHAENEFWKWMASWAVMIRKPSDLGFANDGYDLPPLRQQQHLVAADYAPSLDTGLLFPMEARTMQERLSARRDTVDERVQLAYRLVIGSFCDKLATCHGNQNTPNADAQSTHPTPLKESGESSKEEAPRKTPSTCESTERSTSTNGAALQSSSKRLTGGAASAMQPTPNTENRQRQAHGCELQSSAEQGCYEQSTVLNQSNTKRCSPGKVEDAPSAGLSRSEFSTLTTAMNLARSGGSFAAPVTLALAISRMTQIGSVEPWCIWCNLNSEQDALARAFGPLAFSVSGAMPDEEKERAIHAWLDGERPVMIGKPSMMGFGMNFQHCRNTIFVGLNDSFEQVFQAVRRFWRFGQTKPVNVHFIAAETEGAVVANLRRKEADADRMAAAMVMHMADLSRAEITGTVRVVPDYNPQLPMQLPSFVRAA